MKGLLNLLLHPPPGGSYPTGGRNDGLFLRLFQHGGKLMREGDRLDILRPRMVGEGEIESCQKQHPPSLARVQSAGRMKVSQILMVRPNHRRMDHPLQPVSPFLQCQHVSVTAWLMGNDRRLNRHTGWSKTKTIIKVKHST